SSIFVLSGKTTMSPKYRLPALPLGGERATVVRWLKRPGDPVVAGEPLLIVVSDRAEVALPATADGILGPPLVAEGADVVVGAALALIASERSSPDLTGPGSTLPHSDPSVASTVGAEPAKQIRSPSARRASPVALRIAATEDIDIDELVGSGPGG